MKRIAHLLSAVALALPLLAQASSVFKFNPDGIAGGIATIDIDVLDWAPGNALAVLGNPAGGLVTGSKTQLLYQANLGLTKLDGATNFAGGLSGSPNFTVVAGFEEVATVVGTNANFALTGAVTAPSAKNFFYIYRSAANANVADLAGTGFVSPTLVMSGYVSAVTSSSFAYTDFSANPTGCTGGTLAGTLVFGTLCQTKLDQFGSNNWIGTDTIVGSGSTDLQLTITSVNSSYFPDLTPGGVLTTGLINTSQVDPFAQTNPSRKFSSNGILNGDHATNLGAVNGFNTSTTDKDFIFQADANMSLDRVVPEPGALALVGLALVGLGAASRRRLAK